MVIQTQDDHTKGIFFAREILQEMYLLKWKWPLLAINHSYHMTKSHKKRIAASFPHIQIMFILISKHWG